MRKVIFAGACALLCGVLPAAEQVTIFNLHALMKFEKTALHVRRFDCPDLENLDNERTLRICEAIDNSKFVYFGSKFDVEHHIRLYRALFSSPAVTRSLGDFLKRGGLVYFSPVTWTQLQSWPDGMKAFFAERGAPLPTGKNCLDTSKEKDVEYQVVARPSEAFRDSCFAMPRKTEQIRAIRHFGDLSAQWKPVYVSEKEGWPVMVAADCMGGGRVVFSHVFSVDRVAGSPFYLNVLESLYGADAVRTRSSHKVYLEDAKRRGIQGLHVREVPLFTRLFPDSKLEDGKSGEGIGRTSCVFLRARDTAKSDKGTSVK